MLARSPTCRGPELPNRSYRDRLESAPTLGPVTSDENHGDEALDLAESRVPGESMLGEDLRFSETLAACGCRSIQVLRDPDDYLGRGRVVRVSACGSGRRRSARARPEAAALRACAVRGCTRRGAAAGRRRQFRGVYARAAAGAPRRCRVIAESARSGGGRSQGPRGRVLAPSARRPQQRKSSLPCSSVQGGRARDRTLVAVAARSSQRRGLAALLRAQRPLWQDDPAESTGQFPGGKLGVPRRIEPRGPLVPGRSSPGSWASPCARRARGSARNSGEHSAMRTDAASQSLP
jgi:hypothetical protein